jgi:hypothetical protein
VQLLWAAKSLDEAGTLGAPDDETTKGALLSEVYRRAAGRTPPPRPSGALSFCGAATPEIQAFGGRVDPCPGATLRTCTHKNQWGTEKQQHQALTH